MGGRKVVRHVVENWEGGGRGALKENQITDKFTGML